MPGLDTRGGLNQALVKDALEIAVPGGGKLLVQTIKLHKTELFPEKVVGVAVVGADGTLVVQAGKRHTNLKGVDLEPYIGKRAQRGLKLPRGSFLNISCSRRASPELSSTKRTWSAAFFMSPRRAAT